jgi:hypothetical protein
MITLVGGKYNGKYLHRDPMPVGSTVAIIDGGDHEVYVMRPDGTAVFEDGTGLLWDSFARPGNVSEYPQDLP